MEAQQGFSVTRHAYDLETAWSAVFTSSGTDPEDQDVPTIGFNSEMDALKSGHACGHNLIAISGCASAVATARTLEDFGLPGRVVLLGTPAEEGGGGKAIMLERGAYKGMDACLMLHPGGGSRSGQHGAGIITSNCISGVVATFKGRSSHAGATPEHAINALDAAFVAYSAISALRQQLPPGIKVHGIINGSDQWSPNGMCSLSRGLQRYHDDLTPPSAVIPSSAEMIYGMRAESASALAELIPRVLRCFEGAATATGCSYTLEQKHLYLDLRQCAPLAEAFAQAARRCWHDEGDVGETYEVEMHAKTGASTDFGNVSHVLPALHPMFSLPEAGPGDHPRMWRNSPSCDLKYSRGSLRLPQTRIRTSRPPPYPPRTKPPSAHRPPSRSSPSRSSLRQTSATRCGANGPRTSKPLTPRAPSSSSIASCLGRPTFTTARLARTDRRRMAVAELGGSLVCTEQNM